VRTPFRVAVATVALVAIGAAESLASARGLAEQATRGRPALAPAGSLLTLAGLALSVGVYLGLGRVVARTGGSERRALVEGVATGALAGALGGTVRALAVSDYLGEQVARFGLPVAFLLAALVTFVLLAVLASTAGGGALAWLGHRLTIGTRLPET